MHRSGVMTHISLILLLSSLILSSCRGAPPPAPSPTPESTLPVLETPQPAGERTLVYCNPRIGGDSLYIFANQGNIFSAVAEAIYDGPIDSRSYAFQPVILKKLPSLADGDAQILPVEVKAGDRVVDVTGNPVELAAGVHVHPSGCRSDECAIEYDGASTLQMDQLVARFELLPGLLWSDGDPLTASDSVYSFNLQSDPDTPAGFKSVIASTSSYEALDELTTEWKGLPGYRDSTYNTNFFRPAPEHAWGQYTAAELLTAEESTQKPLGWGPYVVEDFNAEEGITLRKNENYFRSSEGLPHFDRLFIRFLEDDFNANIALLLTGECDVLSNVTMSLLSAEEQELLLELSNNRQISASFIAGTRFEHINFGILPVSYDDGWQPGDRPDFFGDVRVRRAFALCTDRQKMMQVAFSSQSVVPNTYLLPQHPLHNPDVTHYDFDPAAGAALLAEAGWVMGQDGVLVYAGDHPQIPSATRFSVEHITLAGVNEGAVQVMKDSLAQCGIEIKTSYLESEQLFADGPEGPTWGRKFDLAQFRWLTGVEPPCDLYTANYIPGDPSENNPYTGKPFNYGWNGENLTGFSNPEYEQTCLRALQALPGEPGYVENHMKAQQIYAQQLPSLPLYFNIYVGATRPDFCGYQLDPTANVDDWNIEEFDYGPDC